MTIIAARQDGTKIYMAGDTQVTYGDFVRIGHRKVKRLNVPWPAIIGVAGSQWVETAIDYACCSINEISDEVDDSFPHWTNLFQTSFCEARDKLSPADHLDASYIIGYAADTEDVDKSDCGLSVHIAHGAYMTKEETIGCGSLIYEASFATSIGYGAGAFEAMCRGMATSCALSSTCGGDLTMAEMDVVTGEIDIVDVDVQTIMEQWKNVYNTA